MSYNIQHITSKDKALLSNGYWCAKEFHNSQEWSITKVYLYTVCMHVSTSADGISLYVSISYKESSGISFN